MKRQTSHADYIRMVDAVSKMIDAMCNQPLTPLTPEQQARADARKEAARIAELRRKAADRLSDYR